MTDNEGQTTEAPPPAGTGELQARQPNGRLMPPAARQFGKPGGNRRNRNGRPKSFDQFRKLVQRILAEDLPAPDGSSVSRAEALVRVMTSSKAPADRATILAYAYGKPKDEVDLTSGGQAIKMPSIIEIVKDKEE